MRSTRTSRCLSLDLCGREVLGEFKEREEKRTLEKSGRMAPIIERAMQRKRPVETPVHDGATVIRSVMAP